MTTSIFLENLLKHIVNEVTIDRDAQLGVGSRLSTDSVDAQIDGHILKYEKSSLMTEAPKQIQAPSGKSKSKKKSNSKKQPKVILNKPKLNASEFAGHIAKLVQNYDRLLDVPTVIISKALTYISENYDDNLKSEIEHALEDNYGLSLTPEDREPERPAAAGAGPAIG